MSTTRCARCEAKDEEGCPHVERLQLKSQRPPAERLQFARVTTKVLRRWLRRALKINMLIGGIDHGLTLTSTQRNAATRLSADILRVLALPTRGGKGTK